MLLVPRSRADFEGIAVNSLAFAGALFVRDDAELATLERLGPMAVLRGVSFPKGLLRDDLALLLSPPRSTSASARARSCATTCRSRA
jgi:hypothetical protein